MKFLGKLFSAIAGLLLILSSNSATASISTEIKDLQNTMEDQQDFDMLQANLSGKPSEIAQWVNWANRWADWANWADWNDWNDWNDWSDWGNHWANQWGNQWGNY